MKNRAQLAQEIDDIICSDDSDEEKERKRDAILGPLNYNEVVAVFALVDEMHRERVAKTERERKSLKLAASLFNGLEDRKGLTLGEAAEIKAAQGDPIAISLLKKLNSRDAQLFWALLNAAAEAHPEWLVKEDGVLRFIGQGEPQPNALIEWFQMMHPKQAKLIEAAIDRAT
jgi:hypothetical protein